MLLVIDVATTQRNLDFTKPLAEGYQYVYVKNGGDNVDPTYESPYYDAQVDRCRALGFKKIGHYWVPNADPSDADDIDTPVQQADFMIAQLRNWNKATDFIVLDNESLDGALRFNDAQCAEFIERVKSRLGIPGEQVLTYSGLNDARTNVWTATLATGTNFIIAAYSYPAFGWPTFSNIPADRIVGHQTGGKIWPTTTGGTVPVDINTFKDHAFNFGSAPSNPTGDDMAALTQEQADQLLNLYAAMFFGGPSMLDEGKSVQQSLAEIHAAVKADNAVLAKAIVDALVAAGVKADVDYAKVQEAVLTALKSVRFVAE